MSAEAPTVRRPLSERLISPIVIKEMRSTMRGARFFIGITIFLLMIAAISLLIYYAQINDPWANPAIIGRTLFATVTGMESLLLLAIAPSLTAGAIAGERQKQTFEMLMATPLSPGQVLRGKLLAALNYLLLLLLAGIPVNAIVFLFGGVTPFTLVAWMLSLVVVVFMLATLGLMISTMMKRAGLATTVAYMASALIFVVMPGMIFIMTASIGFAGGPPGPELCQSMATLGLLHPLAGLLALNGVFSTSLPNVAPYLALLSAFYLALSGLFYWVSLSRLSALLGVRHRRPWLVIVPLLVAIGAVAAIVLGPAQAFCTA